MRTILGCALVLAMLGVVSTPASAAKPKLSIASVTASEGGGEATLTVTGSRKATKTISFDFATADGTARAGDDYTNTRGTATIKKRKRSTRLAVPIAGDPLDEPDESLSVRLSSPRRAKLADPEAELTIDDDDPLPTVTIATASVTEGTGTNPSHTITAQLTAPSAKPIEVAYATANGTATGLDFAATSGVLSFDPGDALQSFSLTTTGDFVDEPDETLTIGFASAVSTQLPGSPQTLTIADDDGACVSEDSPPGTVLPQLSGDTGSGTVQQNGTITPCGDTDWFTFELTEDNSAAVVDMQARVDLVSTPNSSPSGGDLDLCVRVLSTPATETCSTEGAGVTDTVFICVEDPVIGGGDNSTDFEIEVDGFGLAVNNYELTIRGNVPIGSGPQLDLCA